MNSVDNFDRFDYLWNFIHRAGKKCNEEYCPAEIFTITINDISYGGKRCDYALYSFFQESKDILSKSILCVPTIGESTSWAKGKTYSHSIPARVFELIDIGLFSGLW